MYSIAKAVRRANPVMTSVIALTSVFFFGSEPAKAQCVPTGGNTVTCTGVVPPSIDLTTASFGGTNTLAVSSILLGTTRIGLQGTGSSVADGTDEVAHYDCIRTGTASGGSTPADCTINNLVVPPTCTSTNGDQGQTASCDLEVIIPAIDGPTGKSGPNITINVDAPTSGPLTIGAGRTDIAVFGLSRGSKGGKGGSRCCIGDGHPGGDGVDGGTVLINFTGRIVDGNAGGILAQSIGGDGGKGGHGGETSGDGGRGGKGGYGGPASVRFNGGSITTSGEGNVGITALSQGGDGGDGGGSGWFVSEGGDGEIAGQAGKAEVTTLAGTTISTSGDYAHGIAAYSIGGGGGTGAGGFGLFYSDSGAGSRGGNGGTVTINAAGTITTTGEYAHGILAQSIGGGGGNSGKASGLVALGGKGAAGGWGGTVSLVNSGVVTTHGLSSNAIEAQSIGGGGGNGSNAAGAFALGGTGSGASKGGTVSVTNSGVLHTYSSNAIGILAQSIGGGGGNGGSARGLFTFGGDGGAGADADLVTVTNSGDITTGLGGSALGSPGILAQSIGGGGGNGGGAVSASPGFAAAFGGTGSKAGFGSTVRVNLDNADASLATAYNIRTYGDASSAIIAQSIGGGGGNGGFAAAASVGNAFSVALGVGGNAGAGGAGGSVFVDTKGSLTTSGASSDGILAQSIGGGGGNGGFSVAASVSLGASVSLSLGGRGAAGGNASAVTVSSLADIVALGDSSYGILAQSLGGGGGNGGFSVAGSGGVAGVSLGIGGSGGAGGTADTLNVKGVGDILTYGTNGGGIAAQSIGGGGGNGGFAATGTLALASASVSVGGSGNTGGHAGAVTIKNSGVVLTTGGNSIGILAQSLGGGGGNGGFAGSGSISLAGSVAVGVGGSGGNGQYAGAVSLYADGGTNDLTVTGYGDGWNLVTTGKNSAGIEAQSIGGGGGNGGFAGTLSLAAGTAVGLSLGGSGGGGSYASDVLVHSGYGRSYANNIFTAGDNSAGIVAQSIGGGGGNGGFAVSLSGTLQGVGAAAVTLGGSGGNGSIAGRAEADSVGNITTLGNVSGGMLVQSIGGGGGNGGFSVALSAATSGYTAAVAVGGSGGTGNDGDVASLSSQGTITTYGQQSNGLFAQSIGGGGGSGGFAGAGSLSIAGIGVAVGLGGSGAGGGKAATVDLTNNGSVTTYGNQSSAIIAQSVGGGGGNGGSTVGLALGGLGGASVAIGGKAGAGGNSDKVVVNSAGNLTTGVGYVAGSPSNNAFGILAQSLGGGGGNGGFAGSLAAGGAVGLGVSVGGKGGHGGSAGAVEVTSAGDIATAFDNSGGILAQSIGGGGGNGGFSVALAASAAIEDIGAAAAVSVGGFGGTAGLSSDVLLTSTGTVLTLGAHSDGIAAQSIGGGGGNGGFSVAGAATLGNAGIGISVGGFGAGGGSAKKATIFSYGAGYQMTPAANLITIETDGAQSAGILAQSLGGGGGNGGFSVGAGVAANGAAIGISVGGFGAGGGSANAVAVTSYNNILTKGFESSAIEAQSIGGGGGNGGFAAAASIGSEFAGSVAVGGFALSGGGDGGTVFVDSNGLLATMGDESNAILAQSIGGGGGNGGFALSGALSLGAAGLNASVGGLGSVGGNGAAVTVKSLGLGTPVAPSVVTISTLGVQSNGILAQSIGGGGGNGGLAVGASLAPSGAAIGVSVGGFGAGGGYSGIVEVTSYNNIVTRGYQSNAIAAQSIGGGGGNGGFAAEATGGSEFAGSVAVGGFALGGGGHSNAVTVDSYGMLATFADSSNGILAQSIGGGGGNGGFALSGALSMGSAGLNASIGGKGSDGGNSATVSVDSFGLGTAVTPTAGVVTISTAGIQSNGILAQSIGGGGGNGGFAAGATLAPSGAAIGISVGGFGAGGGSAGAVDLTSYNNIVTAGYQSNALAAQSLGGGGGNGGFAMEATAGSEFAGSVAIGGFALSGGGNAGDVTADSFGTLQTAGESANGILAQSIGGGGGNGGFALSGAFTLGNAGLTASLGGHGSNGGTGSDVSVTSNLGAILTDNLATIYTTGDSANGIEAQSIGGGGGNGGFSGGFTASANAQATISLSVGGFGAAGNRAGSVGVTSIDNILTEGDGANAIIAQSIGGGGGNGGFSFAGTLSIPVGESLSLSASLGGFGGSGGDADIVSVSSTGIISTFGDEASGVVAQSVGGGGGNGGISVAGSFNFSSVNNVPSITASVGGLGGSGGAGSDVEVTRVGATKTTGEKSIGILAQSIGGGGGNGGIAVSGSIGGPDSKQINASVGGFGGAGSEAGNVTVRNTGSITTGAIVLEQIQIAQPGRVFITAPVEYGYASHGILAQSIGGGGGNGGFAFSGSVAPTGTNTTVQVGITVGGFGGSGGAAGNVDVGNDGLITTFGAAADGILAQSIGGGGGNGGGALTGMLSGGDPQSGARTVQVAISVGGKGGNGNVAGNVVVEQTGGIVTHGDDANGILAQSIGGGGGNGGGANTLALQLATSCTFTIPKAPQIGNCEDPKSRSVNAQIDVGGFGGTGNDAGTVKVTNHSSITTSGLAASGVVAQSIGGGGGNGGHAIIGLGEMFPGATYLDIATTVATLPIGLTGAATGFGKVTVGGFGGSAGDGDAVVVDNRGVIHTSSHHSYGIIAQSIGGGGGSGGNAASGVTGLLSVGGFGAASGAGGSVSVNNALGADIVTTGEHSTAIFAQSIGGGGGDGGTAGGLIAMGGFGGASGSGGTVDVVNAANLQTFNEFANGILAQSIGGGGGNGGGTGLSGIAVGGMAGVLGSTGDGGTVRVHNMSTATILTKGKSSNGIFAQSIGGGGGNGGGSTLAAAVTVGGMGGSSGSGGLVQIVNEGQIETDGFASFGVFAQSIGGSGGNGGGSNVSAINVGGFGGSSGDGGEVDVTNQNLIHTFGLGSDAIRAQSVGGGGGNAGGVADSITSGGLSAALVDIGGGGGAAGNGGLANVINSATLVTDGLAAAAIRAQSVGGGGGDGGRAIGIESIGGFGGAAGNGGAVIVANNVGGIIWTKGIISDGIFAQSVGGGGGNGGGAYSGSPVGISESIGGNGAGGGDGGSVLVNNFALVQTDGLASTAIFAQSVGGGGGNGGVAGSYNAQVLSLPAVGVSVGGSGGIGGNGGIVTVNNRTTGSIVSNGAFSTAIFAQSVGGGGGKGGYAMTSSVAQLGSVAVSLGGSGGAGGNGDAVSVTNAGQIVINGKNSVAIMAQSVGGGGGIAGASMGVASVPVTIGGQTGANGTGGDVSVVNTGSITINGNNSIGIFAQSVGGGGGMVSPGGSVTSVEKAAGGTGDGGTVTIDNTAGSIVINGENSIAMYLQSVGGGGGAVGLDADPPGQIGAFLFSGTSGGSGAALATNINQSGNLIATGFNSIALVAQSSATGGVGDITVDILNPAGSRSLIIGGSGQGAGVEILDGADNVLNNAGVIGATSTAITGNVTGFSADDGTFTVAGGRPVSGTAGYGIMASGTANTTINNTGVINGSIDLGMAGTNAFFNAAGATFNPGTVVILGSGILTNAGTLAAGGFNNVSTAAITGNLAQSATGTTGVDLDLRAAATDLITVSGTAAMSGVVRTNLINPLVSPGYALPGTHAPLILTATGGVTHPNLTLQAFNTAVATYSLAYPNAQSVALQYVIDYSPSGLTANQHSLGNIANAIQTAQTSPDFRPIATNLFYLPDVKSLGAAYDSLSGEGMVATEQAAFDANAHFLAALGTQTSDWMSDSPRDLDHSWHLWLTPYGNGAIYGGSAATGSTKVTQTAYGIGGGIDYQISPHAVVGAAIGGGTTWFKVSDRATTGAVDALHFGLYGAWNEEEYYVSGALSYDMFNNVESRLAAIPGVTLPSSMFVDGPYNVSGFGENPSGRFDSSSLSGHFEVGYREDLGPVQVTPFVGLEFGSLDMDGFTETNGIRPSVIGLTYAEQTINSLPSLLGVQFDAKSDLGDGQTLSAWVKATWKHEFDISRVTDSSFISAPGFAFKVHGAEPSRDAARTDVGVKLMVDSQLALFANFGGEFGGPSSSYAGTAGISIKW